MYYFDPLQTTSYRGGINITLTGTRGFTAITSAKIYYTDDSTVLSENTTVRSFVS